MKSWLALTVCNCAEPRTGQEDRVWRPVERIWNKAAVQMVDLVSDNCACTASRVFPLNRSFTVLAELLVDSLVGARGVGVGWWSRDCLRSTSE